MIIFEALRIFDSEKRVMVNFHLGFESFSALESTLPCSFFADYLRDQFYEYFLFKIFCPFYLFLPIKVHWNSSIFHFFIFHFLNHIWFVQLAVSWKVPDLTPSHEIFLQVRTCNTCTHYLTYFRKEDHHSKTIQFNFYHFEVISDQQQSLFIVHQFGSSAVISTYCTVSS